MSLYDQITKKLQDDFLNSEVGDLFNLQYINNTSNYDIENLTSDSQIKGVVSLISSTSNTLSDTGQENKLDVLNLELLIPLDSNSTYHRNLLLNGLTKFNNEYFEAIDGDADIQINNVQIIQDSKYDGFINGTEYEHIIVQFTSLVTVDFLYSNNAVFTIDGEEVDCKAEVILSANKILEGKMTADGIQRGQSNGIQYAFTVVLTYNKNNNAHRKMLRNWQLKDTFRVGYTLDVLQFERDCQLTSYTMNAITGDTIKLSLVFQERSLV